jgi:hypothetical protein
VWAEAGILLLIAVVWYVSNARRTPKNHDLPVCRRVSWAPRPLAKGKPRLVNCSVATKHVPMYKRSAALRTRAQVLATSVAEGKKVIAAHTEFEKLGACALDCKLRTVIAGVVRDRKELKTLEYDQPF